MPKHIQEESLDSDHFEKVNGKHRIIAPTKLILQTNVEYGTTGNVDIALDEPTDGIIRCTVDSNGYTQFFYVHGNTDQYTVVGNAIEYTGEATSLESVGSSTPTRNFFMALEENINDTAQMSSNLDGNYRFLEVDLRFIYRDDISIPPISYKLIAASTGWGNEPSESDMSISLMKLT